MKRSDPFLPNLVEKKKTMSIEGRDEEQWAASRSQDFSEIATATVETSFDVSS